MVLSVATLNMRSQRRLVIGAVVKQVLRKLSPPVSRHFTVTTVHQVKSTELSKEQLAGIRIDQHRLWRELHRTCEWGTGERWGKEPTDTGMSRLALSDADKQARDWFVETTESLGCRTIVDCMGNIFAIRPGLNDGPPTFAGSHLDTQPSGGRYDGILGVHAGIEALRTMRDKDIQTEYPVGVINWTNEEGARFPVSMISSAVFAGEISLEKAHSLQEVGGGNATMKSELERIGYLGAVDASHEVIPIGAHFELHIEQGPILEESGRKIGVVEGVQAYRWFSITVTGRDCHTGTTDFSNRSDAMLTSAKLIVHSHNRATDFGCLASTGILTLKPGSTNTVPGFVQFSLDIRAPDESRVIQLEQTLKSEFDEIATGGEIGGMNSKGVKGKGCRVEWRCDSVSPAVRFHEDCIQCVEASGEDILDNKNLTQRMTSGAGHDRLGQVDEKVMVADEPM